MKIVMSYIDYNIADLSQREKISFTKSEIEYFYSQVSLFSGVLGSFMLSTCNRTEVYLSLEDDADYDPFKLVYTIFNISEQNTLHQTLYNQQAIRHLCLLSCGVLSKIWGEDQIIAQVKDAADYAREKEATDTFIEVLLRTAISCGKKVKTNVEFSKENLDAAQACLNILKTKTNVEKVLVIGNGVMGRLVTRKLLENGYQVVVTLRRYKYKINEVPKGATCVEYDDRYHAMNNSQAVVSATASPHLTVRLEEFVNVATAPKILIDLAVPRDIDEKIYHLENINCYNIDQIDLSVDNRKKQEILEQVNLIVEKHICDFYRWHSYKIKMLVEA